MRSRFGRSGTVAGFFVVATAALCVSNIWITLARSAIPLSLNDDVAELAWHRAEKERRAGKERRFGFDNACLVTLASGRVLELDSEVYLPLRIGDHLEKRAWDDALYRNGKTVQLRVSGEAFGMIVFMPAVLAGALTLSLAHLRQDPGVSALEAP